MPVTNWFNHVQCHQEVAWCPSFQVDLSKVSVSEWCEVLSEAVTASAVFWQDAYWAQSFVVIESAPTLPPLLVSGFFTLQCVSSIYPQDSQHFVMGNLHFMHIVGWQPLETESFCHWQATSRRKFLSLDQTRGMRAPDTDYPHVHTRIHGQIWRWSPNWHK